MALPHIPVSDKYYKDLQDFLSKAKTTKELYQLTVDAPFQDKAVTTMLGLGIVVLLLTDKEAGTINRIALAQTDLARGTVEMSAKPFNQIKIPLDSRENYISIAIRRKHYMITTDWQYLFVPALTPEEARFNQAGGAIACSVVYPLSDVGDGGALIFSYYEFRERIGAEHHKFMRNYTNLVTKAFKAKGS